MHNLNQVTRQSSQDYKTNFLNSIYLKACDFMLDYGGLLSSITAGVALGDHDRIVFNESLQGLRGGTIAYGAILGIILPGVEKVLMDREIRKDPEYFLSHEKDNALNNYIGTELGRNLFAGFSGWQIMETIQNPSLPNLLTSIIIVGTTTVGFILSNKDKKHLEDLISNSNPVQL